jgi:RNA polymerase sigma factor (sigma-70 family)
MLEPVIVLSSSWSSLSDVPTDNPPLEALMQMENTFSFDRLTIDVTDTEAVNALFIQHLEQPTQKRQEQVLLWTYCFILNYFYAKGRRYPSITESDIDELISTAMQRVDRGDPSNGPVIRYAHWVSKICSYTLIDYWQRQNRIQQLQRERLAEPGEASLSDVPPDHFEKELVYLSGKLPVYLQDVVRYRYVEDLSYDTIADRLGTSAATVRSYAHRARAQLKKMLSHPE